MNQELIEFGADLGRLFVSKATDYGKEPILKFGHLALALRLDSKGSRLNSLNRREGLALSDETIVDTVTDIFGYCLIWEMLSDGSYEKAPILSRGEKEISDVKSYEDEIGDRIEDYLNTSMRVFSSKESSKAIRPDLLLIDIIGGTNTVSTLVEGVIKGMNLGISHIAKNEEIQSQIFNLALNSMLYLILEFKLEKSMKG